MKLSFLRPLIIGLLLALPLFVRAQIGFNSGAGVKPKLDVEMYSRNGFMVQTKYAPTTADPNASINNISCVTNPPVLTALAGILKDPNGDSPYTAGIPYSCSAIISLPTANTANYPWGIELTFNQLDTEAGVDKVVIEGYAGRLEFSGNTLPPVFTYPYPEVIVRFITNNNASVGQGFRLQWRMMVLEPTVLSASTVTPFSYGLFFGTGLNGLGAFRAGYLNAFDMQNMGSNSAALGNNNIASGLGSIALGNKNVATDGYTMGESNTATSGGTAIGRENDVTGNTAIGFRNIIRNGSGSVALGVSNTMVIGTDGGVGTGIALGNGNYLASGGMTMGYSNTATTSSNVAIGRNNQATGLYNAMAVGTLASASHIGSLVIGDGTPVNNDAAVLAGTGSTASAQFTARFRGGVRFITDFNANTGGSLIGAQLIPGANAWSAISDSTKKERFLPLNHTDLLARLRTLRLGTWNYKGQRTERHYGPMAQDFFARFGHDSYGVIGCDTLLNSHDFTAVTLSGVQALALENETLKAEIAQLKQLAQVAERERAQTTARLEAIERQVFVRPAPRITLASRRKRTR